jgi:hypothetical protein
VTESMDAYTCCAFTWPTPGVCSAWGQPSPEHACKERREHEGDHVCVCGVHTP